MQEGCGCWELRGMRKLVVTLMLAHHLHAALPVIKHLAS